jgi:DNA-binding protein YbaB
MMKKNFQALYLPFNVIVVGKKNDKSVKVLADFQKTNVSVKIDQEFVIQNSDEVLKKASIDINYSWLPIELISLFSVYFYV